MNSLINILMCFLEDMKYLLNLRKSKIRLVNLHCRQVTNFSRSVHWGIKIPLPSKTPPSSFSLCPLKSANCPSPNYLTPSHLLKVTKFLVKISQFIFLVMTEKNIFVYKLFLSLDISDFSLFFM